MSVKMRVFGLAAAYAAAMALGTRPAIAQPIRPLRTLNATGKINALAEGLVAITDETGKSWQMKISRREDGAVSLGGARLVVKIPASIKVSGTLGMESLAPGFPIRFQARLNRAGKVAEPVSEISWLDDEDFSAGIKTSKKPAASDGYVDGTITGEVENIRNDRMVVRVPRSRYARKGRLLVPLAQDGKVTIHSDNLRKVQPGDHVTKAQAIEFNTGELVIQSMEIQLAGNVSEKAVARDADSARFREYSDEPAAPRPLRSRHFIVHTDMSERDTRILLNKLETMVALLSQYYGRPQKGIIECYVIRDLNSWPPDMFPPDAIQRITDKAGITLSQSSGRQTKSVVYSCDKLGVVQHEAVHAFCHQTFGGVGPTWYAEGMAEMGRYWKESQLAVDVDPVVIDYLTQAEQAKTLKEIVATDQITGDSWEAYSWRWALCQLLATNPNYNRNFKMLGIALMTRQPNVSFQSVYGRVAKQLSFEYDQFVTHVGNGYRADLCAWQWNKKFVPIVKKGHQTIRVQAKAGWQPSSIYVKEGTAYDYVSKGQWKIEGAGDGVTAEGASEGQGKMTAAIMNDYHLGEPIPLGDHGTFEAPSDGNLYLRCGEEWTRLGDNSGTINVYIRLSKGG